MSDDSLEKMIVDVLRYCDTKEGEIPDFKSDDFRTAILRAKEIGYLTDDYKVTDSGRKHYQNHQSL